VGILLLAEKTCIDIRDMTDEELAVLARMGTENGRKAENELISRYSEKIMVKARMLSGTGAEYDDLWQEGLISLLGAIYAYDPSRGAKFSTFSEVCILNRMRSVCSIRKNPSVNCDSLDELCGDEIASGVEDPESQFLYKELLSELKNGIASELSSAERRTFELCVQGVSYRRAARMLGISEKAVDNAMQRARRKLRTIYNNFNVAV